MAFCRGAFAEVPEAPRRFVVRSRCWNNQLDLRAAIYFAPDRQLAAHKFGSFGHAAQRDRDYDRSVYNHEEEFRPAWPTFQFLLHKLFAAHPLRP
jgi:hypothetical protein